MNKEYLKWMRTVFDQWETKQFEKIAFLWLRGQNSEWRKMYHQGLTPRQAAFNLIPW